MYNTNSIYILVQKIHAKPLWSRGAKNTIKLFYMCKWYYLFFLCWWIGYGMRDWSGNPPVL